MRYSILDPTGNITALVEDAVDVCAQPEVARQVMCRHPEVEQVGFVRLGTGREGAGTPLGSLRMAGGEFCGNATISAAALLQQRHEELTGCQTCDTCALTIEVSGAREPVEVRLVRRDGDRFDAAVHMPRADRIEHVYLSFAGVSDWVPLVILPGISHAVISSASALYALKDAPEAAERAVRVWCAELGVEGLGCMFWEEGGKDGRMTPLVYVPAADTVFWESSCASGSCAVAVAVAAASSTPVDLALIEPAGTLRAVVDRGLDVWLHGGVSIVATYDVEVTAPSFGRNG